MLKKILLSVLIVSAYFSCDKNTEEEGPNQRTVLVYLGRDNNLSGTEEDKLKSIMNGWDGTNGKLLVFQDTKQDKPCLQEVYHSDGVNHTRIITAYENENSADPALLEQVLREMVNRFPALSYGLIVFSHASGWLPEGALVSPRSIIEDQKREMELTDFSDAIPDRLFDFIIFEACFMGGIEVMYELKEKTDYILVSSAELLSPGFAPIYLSSIDELFLKEPDLLQFAKNAFDYVDKQSGLYRSGTLSIIKTSELTALGNFIKTTNWLPEEVNVDAIQYFDRNRFHLFFDFEDYYQEKTDNELVKTELAELINACVIYRAATPYFMSKYGFQIKRHSGLTTYIEQEEYPYLNQEYQKLRWYREVLCVT